MGNYFAIAFSTAIAIIYFVLLNHKENSSFQVNHQTSNIHKTRATNNFIENFVEGRLERAKTQINNILNTKSTRCRPDCSERKNIIHLTKQGTAGGHSNVNLAKNVNKSYLI